MAACDRFSKGALQQHLREQGFGVNVSAVSEQYRAGECEQEWNEDATHWSVSFVIASEAKQSSSYFVALDCFASLAMTMLMTTMRKSRARPWGTGSRARSKRSGGTPPPYRSASARRRVTPVEHQQHQAECQQYCTEDHAELGIGRRLRQRDRGGRGNSDRKRTLQGRDLHAAIGLGAPFRRGRRQLRTLAKHFFKIPAGRQVDRKCCEPERLTIGPTRRLVDRNQAGQPGDELMFQ